MKRKRSESSAQSVSKRLKALNSIIKRETPAVMECLQEKYQAVQEHRDKIADFHRQIKLANEAFHSREQAIETKHATRMHRQADAVEAKYALEVVLKQVKQNMSTMKIWSFERLWDQSTYGPEFYKVINEVFGGVVLMDGFVPFKLIRPEFEWKISNDAGPVVGWRKWANVGPIYVDVSKLSNDLALEKDEKDATGLIDFDDFQTDPEFQAMFDNVQGDTCRLKVRLYGLSLNPQVPKVKLEPPASTKSLIDLLKLENSL